MIHTVSRYRVTESAETVLEAKHKVGGVLRPTVTKGLPSHLTHVPWSTLSERKTDSPPLLRALLFPPLNFCLESQIHFIYFLSSFSPTLSECLIIFFCLRYAWQGVSGGGATLTAGRYAQLPGWVVGLALHVWQIDINSSRDLSAFPKLTPMCQSLFQHWLLQSTASYCKSHQIVRPLTTFQIPLIIKLIAIVQFSRS